MGSLSFSLSVYFFSPTLIFTLSSSVSLSPSFSRSLSTLSVDSVLMEVEDVRAERAQQGRTLVEILTRGAKVDKKASEALVIWMNGTYVIRYFIVGN